MGQPGSMTLFMAIVVVVCMGVCSLGLQNGVEKITKVMMICLLAVLVVLVVRALTPPGAAEGLKFYLKPDLNNLMYDANGNFVLGQAVYAAMGQAFFTFSSASVRWPFSVATSAKSTGWPVRRYASACWTPSWH